MRPKTSPTAAKSDILKKIAEGNNRRLDEAKKQREYEREQQEEAEEAKTLDRGDVSKFISNIIISLLFISLPLTEPVIDWIQVGVFTAANVVWNVFFHRHTWMHYATFIMINILLVQWTHEMYNIPKWLAAVPLEYYVGFAIGNGGACLAAYFFYIDKVTKRRERDERLDIVTAVLLLVNIVALVACGAIPLSLLYHAFKSLVGLIS